MNRVEASAAEHRTSIGGLEGHYCLLAALRANDLAFHTRELDYATVCAGLHFLSQPIHPAGSTPLWLVSELFI